VWTIAVAILRDSNSADDMVQEATTVALGKLQDFDPRTSFAAWFGQIVRFVSLNESRKRRRSNPQPDEVFSGVASRAGASARPAFDDRVSAALEALDEVPRTCVLMRTLHNMSFAEIAVALGIPEGTAMSHVHRARAHLRGRLADLAKGGDV